MTQCSLHIIGLILLSGLFPWTSQGLEALTVKQLKQATAQAGIDIAMQDVVVEVQSNGFTLINPDDSSQYLTFDDIRVISQLDTGASDINQDGSITHLSIDVVDDDGQIMFYAESPDLELSTDMVVNNIDFAGTVIGALDVQAMVMSAFHVYLGPHAGSHGVDVELGCRLTLDSVSFGYNETDSLSWSGITLARSFGGTLEDSATWAPSGKFMLGNLAENNPVNLDVTADTMVGWTMTDSDGVSYTVNNPRNNGGYVVMNMPLQGSVRVEHMDFGGKDMGLLAIDGMDVQKLIIEIPGRGLGKP